MRSRRGDGVEQAINADQLDDLVDTSSWRSRRQFGEPVDVEAALADGAGTSSRPARSRAQGRGPPWPERRRPTAVARRCRGRRRQRLPFPLSCRAARRRTADLGMGRHAHAVRHWRRWPESWSRVIAQRVRLPGASISGSTSRAADQGLGLERLCVLRLRARARRARSASASRTRSRSCSVPRSPSRSATGATRPCPSSAPSTRAMRRGADRDRIAGRGRGGLATRLGGQQSAPGASISPRSRPVPGPRRSGRPVREGHRGRRPGRADAPDPGNAPRAVRDRGRRGAPRRRSAASRPAVAAALRGGARRTEDLDFLAEGPEFVAELRAFLDEHGHLGQSVDDLVLASWGEEPALVLAEIAKRLDHGPEAAERAARASPRGG